ncbi:glycoside hydrolase family 30 beta sandwich domain-containing protein [Galbibacter sp. PAP.153]|uniref:glycoside hydrolase family 30 protein n=1 Tax=Galbibacter sp. PAP.153 TaxID=3104623 RepID=UPI00300A1611
MLQKYNLLLLGIAFIAFSCSTKKEQQNNDASLWVTSLDKSVLLKKVPIENHSEKSPGNAVIINIDTTKTYQTMDGFGYSLTGGSAMHLYKMSDSARIKILEELFGTGKNSIGASYLRISIGSSDLDEKPWSYDDIAEGKTDENLEHFSLAYDTLYLIPVLKDILKINPDIKIMGSPWSPPKWMKTNNDTRGGSLKEAYHEVYAQYFVKYLKAMEEHGITLDAITVQNEPLHPGNNPSTLMLAAQQADFIKHNLGPAFNKNNITTKIVIYDHNADRIDYPISILDDPEAAKYIDGAAFHLYGGEIDALSKVHQKHPDKNLYFTEQWVGAPGDFEKEMEWHTENLIIGATRNWCKTVLEWNLAADEKMDPHTDRGGCDICLGAITIKGDSVTRNPAYYIVAQASKFIPPGSVRVASSTNDTVPNVTFKTKEGKIVSVMLNKTDQPQQVQIKIGHTNMYVQVMARAVATLVQ